MTTATIAINSTSENTTIVLCESPRKHQPEKVCGSMIAVRVAEGWEVVCSKGHKHILPLD